MQMVTVYFKDEYKSVIYTQEMPAWVAYLMTERDHETSWNTYEFNGSQMKAWEFRAAYFASSACCWWAN